MKYYNGRSSAFRQMAPAHYDHKDSTNVRSRNNFLIGQYVRELSMCNKLIFFFLRPSFDTLCSNRVRGYEMHRGQRWNRGRGWRRYGLRRFAYSQLRNHLYLNISPQLHTVTLLLCKNPAPCIKQSSYTYFEDTLALHTLVGHVVLDWSWVMFNSIYLTLLSLSQYI